MPYAENPTEEVLPPLLAIIGQLVLLKGTEYHVQGYSVPFRIRPRSLTGHLQNGE